MSESSKRYRRQRAEIFKILGDRCKCGYSDKRALQFDHRHGGGRVAAKQGGSWTRLHKVILAHPEDYQILCSNCNSIKRVENREIPHRFSGPRKRKI